MCTRVSEVVCGPICRVDHVGLFVEVFRCGGQRLCPYVLGVQWVVVKTQSFLSPRADDPAVCVMIDGVHLVVTTHRAVTVVFLPESALGAPSPQDGVPASEADSRREVFMMLCRLFMYLLA